MKILSFPQQAVQQFQQTRSNLRLKKQVDTFLGSLRISDSTNIELNRLNALGVRLCIDRKTQKQYVEISHPDTKKPLAVGYEKARSYRLFNTRPADVWKLNNFRPTLKQENSSKTNLNLSHEEKQALLMRLNSEAHRRAHSQPSVPLFSYLKGELVDIPESYGFTPEPSPSDTESNADQCHHESPPPTEAAPEPTAPPTRTRKEPIFVQTVFDEDDADNDSVVGPPEEPEHIDIPRSTDASENNINTPENIDIPRNLDIPVNTENTEEETIVGTEEILDTEEDDIFYDAVSSFDETEAAQNAAEPPVNEIEVNEPETNTESPPFHWSTTLKEGLAFTADKALGALLTTVSTAIHVGSQPDIQNAVFEASRHSLLLGFNTLKYGSIGAFNLGCSLVQSAYNMRYGEPTKTESSLATRLLYTGIDTALNIAMSPTLHEGATRLLDHSIQAGIYTTYGCIMGPIYAGSYLLKQCTHNGQPSNPLPEIEAETALQPETIPQPVISETQPPEAQLAEEQPTIAPSVTQEPVMVESENHEKERPNLKILSIPQQTVQQFHQAQSNHKLTRQVDAFFQSLRISDTTDINLARLNELGVRLCIDRNTQQQYLELSHPEAEKPLAVGYQKVRSYRLFHTQPADTWQLNNCRTLLKQGNSNQEALCLTPEEKHALLMQLNSEVHRGNERQPSAPLFSYLKGELVDIPEAYRFTAAREPFTDTKEPIFVQTVFDEGDSDTDSVVNENTSTPETECSLETKHPAATENLLVTQNPPATENHEVAENHAMVPTELNFQKASDIFYAFNIMEHHVGDWDEYKVLKALFVSEIVFKCPDFNYLDENVNSIYDPGTKEKENGTRFLNEEWFGVFDTALASWKLLIARSEIDFQPNFNIDSIHNNNNVDRDHVFQLEYTHFSIEELLTLARPLSSERNIHHGFGSDEDFLPRQNAYTAQLIKVLFAFVQKVKQQPYHPQFRQIAYDLLNKVTLDPLRRELNQASDEQEAYREMLSEYRQQLVNSLLTAEGDAPTPKKREHEESLQRLTKRTTELANSSFNSPHAPAVMPETEMFQHFKNLEIHFNHLDEYKALKPFLLIASFQNNRTFWDRPDLKVTDTVDLAKDWFQAVEAATPAWNRLIQKERLNLAAVSRRGFQYMLHRHGAGIHESVYSVPLVESIYTNKAILHHAPIEQVVALLKPKPLSPQQPFHPISGEYQPEFGEHHPANTRPYTFIPNGINHRLLLACRIYRDLFCHALANKIRVSQRFSKHYSAEALQSAKAMMYLLYQPETCYNQYTKDEHFKTFSVKNRLNNAFFHDMQSHIPDLKEAIDSIDQPWTFFNHKLFFPYRLPRKPALLALPASTTAEKKPALMGGDQKPAQLKNTEAEENAQIEENTEAEENM